MPGAFVCFVRRSSSFVPSDPSNRLLTSFWQVELPAVASVDARMEELDRQILLAALSLFGSEGSEPEMVSASDIAQAAGITEAQLLDRFQGAGHVLSVCYVLLVEDAERKAHELAGFDLFAFEERLATFVFVLLDEIEQHEQFVRRTFAARGDGVWSPFQDALRAVLSDLLSAADVFSANRAMLSMPPAKYAMSESVVQLVDRWLSDDSADRQRSTALIDRVVSWWASVATSDVAEKSLDLIRYGVEAGYLPIGKIPVVRDWLGLSKSEQEASDN